MTKIYACLAGDWVCLTDEPNCKIGSPLQSLSSWLDAGAPLYAPAKRSAENSYLGLDHVHVFYKGKDWRINPIYIQIVIE